MKTIIAVPCSSNEPYLKMFNDFEKSLRKFHPDIEVRRIDNPTPGDKDFWYRAKPVIAVRLFDEGYERLILADADQIVLGSLADILDDKDEYDVGVVLNDPTYPIQVWDIRWPYFNNGLVVLKNKEFAKHWERLCYSQHFNNYQYREQDFLNMLASDYFNYKVKILEGTKVYGEWGKPQWTTSYMKEDKIFTKMQDQERQLCIYHSGGGNSPDKMNYRIRFPQEVSDYIDKLIK